MPETSLEMTSLGIHLAQGDLARDGCRIVRADPGLRPTLFTTGQTSSTRSNSVGGSAERIDPLQRACAEWCSARRRRRPVRRREAARRRQRPKAAPERSPHAEEAIAPCTWTARTTGQEMHGCVRDGTFKCLGFRGPCGFNLEGSGSSSRGAAATLRSRLTETLEGARAFESRENK